MRGCISAPERSCSLNGCKDKTSSQHSFPHPKYPRLFDVWIKACKNKELLQLTLEEAYKRKKICHKHFTPANISSNMYLKKDAIPTLLLAVHEKIIPSTLEEEMLAISSTEKQEIWRKTQRTTENGAKTSEQQKVEMTLTILIFLYELKHFTVMSNSNLCILCNKA
ncbi:hypothetical protein Trydic_g5529 [Trypoxylus dichotomus]